ncbi:MAG: 3-carboxyethylcatechol 2,3-dioxygenase [Gammaproteobacteria bacterium]
MAIRALCASHTPLKDFHDPGAEAYAEVSRCFEDVRAWVHDFAPELVVVFGPDHFNGFFYRLMPPFCIGAAAESVGDWNTPSGPLPVASAIAESCARYLHANDLDVAISYRMDLDHGLTQTLQMTFDWDALPPVLPVFVNCAAPPRPPIRRVIALGRALGAFLKARPERVLVVGSGGLSHDPPMPALATAPPPVRERIVAGGLLSPEARAARQERVVDEGRRQAEGRSDAVPLNPAWDRHVLDLLVRRDFAALAMLDDEEISREGGCGGHEIRAWIATAAALSVLPATTSHVRMYRPIPQWVAGFGVMTID